MTSPNKCICDQSKCRRCTDQRAIALQDVVDLIEDLIPLVNAEEKLLLQDLILEIMLIREKKS